MAEVSRQHMKEEEGDDFAADSREQQRRSRQHIKEEEDRACSPSSMRGGKDDWMASRGKRKVDTTRPPWTGGKKRVRSNAGSQTSGHYFPPEHGSPSKPRRPSLSSPRSPLQDKGANRGDNGGGGRDGGSARRDRYGGGASVQREGSGGGGGKQRLNGAAASFPAPSFMGKGFCAAEKELENRFGNPGAPSPGAAAAAGSLGAVEQAGAALPSHVLGLAPSFAAAGGNGAKAAGLKFDTELETDAHKVNQRQKQIDFGKNTKGYEVYLQAVPKKARSSQDPRTPDPHRRRSKRAFDGLVRQWRRRLHEWDPPVDGSEVVVDPLEVPSSLASSTGGADTGGGSAGGGSSGGGASGSTADIGMEPVDLAAQDAALAVVAAGMGVPAVAANAAAAGIIAASMADNMEEDGELSDDDLL